MIVTDIDGGAERRLLCACITSADFLSRCYGRLGDSPFRSDSGNLIWTWCQEHYKKFSAAPGKDIQSIFQQHCRSHPGDKDKNQGVNRVLVSLSGQYEVDQSYQIGYDLELAERWFNEVLLGRHIEQVNLLLSRGQAQEAMKLQREFVPVDLSSPPFVDLLNDSLAQRQAFEEQANVLIRFSGDAGKFFGDEFAEDSLVAVMAPAKGKKSYTLLHLAWEAFKQGRKVAYFQVGDLSRGQIIRRFQRRAAYRPMKAGTWLYPKEMVLAQEDERIVPLIERESLTYTTPLSWAQAEAKWREACAKYKGSIRLSCHSTRSVSMYNIRSIIRSWEREGWLPHCIIIDYAGNLAPTEQKLAAYQQTDYSWAMMRQISEERKCLVITANQSNKESFSSWVLTRKHFSDSKMILAHVTAFMGVNITDEEAEMEVQRYNFIVRRDEKFNETYCLWCASHLAIGNPMVLARLPERQEAGD